MAQCANNPTGVTEDVGSNPALDFDFSVVLSPVANQLVSRAKES